MSSDKNKKRYTFEDLSQELDFIPRSKKQDIKQISDIFGRIQDIKDIKTEEIGSLFAKAISISDKDSWEFLLEIYSRFYNRSKIKRQEEVIRLIEKEVKRRLNSFITTNDINTIVYSISNDVQDGLLEECFNKVDDFCKRNDYTVQEAIAYLYVVLLIVARQNYSLNDIVVGKIERKLFVRFAKNDKNDPLFVKSVKKSLFEGKFAEKFKEMTHLYDGVDAELEQLREDNNHKKEIISSKVAEIRELRENILALNDEISGKLQEIKEKEAKIADLELLVSKTEDRNEYDKNLYEQQYISLKRSFVEKLKNNLQIEFDGLEDIADTVSDVQKDKIRRRIDRMYKILEKSGD